MMCLVFIWLLFRYEEFSLKWLCVFLIFMSIHAVSELHNLILLITCCKMGMALPEGRPTCLVCVPPELTTFFLCLRIERKFISVLLAFWTWKRFLLAMVFCKPQYSCKFCTLLSSKTTATAFMITRGQNIIWWKLRLGVHITVWGSVILLPHVFPAYCSLDKSVTSNPLFDELPRGPVSRRKSSKEKSFDCLQQTYIFLCLNLHASFSCMYKIYFWCLATLVSLQKEELVTGELFVICGEIDTGCGNKRQSVMMQN